MTEQEAITKIFRERNNLRTKNAMLRRQRDALLAAALAIDAWARTSPPVELISRVDHVLIQVRAAIALCDKQLT